MSKRVNFADLYDLKIGRPPEKKVDARTETSEATTVGRPQPAQADAQPKAVDAIAPTTPPVVDAKPPTALKRGRQSRKKVGAHKKDRHRADLVRQHFRLNPVIDEQFRLFRAKHNLELQEFYELAGVHYIEHVGVHLDVEVDALASHDDRDKMIMFKTSPSIINLYLQYNAENRWKPADDYEGVHYNDKDIRIIEIGIIQTQFNARFKKINSFKYYTTEIDIALETPLASETIDIMLKQGRRRWQEATGNNLT